MVRPRSTTTGTPKPATSFAIENQFEKSRDTCVNITNSYSVAQQEKSQKSRISFRTQGVVPGGKKITYGGKAVSRQLPYTDTLDAHYNLFESRRRPKSAKPAVRTPSPTVRRSKSSLSMTRAVTPTVRSPIPRPSSTVTLTPKTVTPRLTKCKDLKPRPSSGPPRPVFSSFKPKTVTKINKGEDEFVPEYSKIRSRSTTPNDRTTLSWTFASTPSVNQSSGGIGKQTHSPKPKSARELFCNCASSQPKISFKYATSLSTWNGHDATTKEYENLVHMWSTQGLHWINCAGGEMCSRAVEGGHTRTGEPLYIARGLTPDGTKCIGTFHPLTGMCYIPWKGKEIITDDYELLCYRSRIQSPAVLYNYRPATNLMDSFKVLTLRNTLRNRRPPMC